MKGKKVTDAVLEANRHNAKSSTGPRTEKGKANSSRNGLRHGILARKVVLSGEEEQVYQALWESWNEHFHPKGAEEKFRVEEIAITCWKIAITEGLEVPELLRRQRVGDQVDGVFRGDFDLPISARDLPLDKGWDCERIVVRAVAGKDSSQSSASRGPAIVQNQVVSTVQNSQKLNSQKAGHLEVEAVLGNSLGTISRYRSTLKRELNQAMDALRALQAERRERERKGGDS